MSCVQSSSSRGRVRDRDGSDFWQVISAAQFNDCRTRCQEAPALLCSRGPPRSTTESTHSHLSLPWHLTHTPRSLSPLSFYFSLADIDECAGGPCEHGGTCVDLIGGFRCECPPEWRGDVCQLDVNECEASYAAALPATTLLTTTASAIIASNLSSSAALLAALTSAVAASSSASGSGGGGINGPCINAHECLNLPGSFSCLCLEGWGGATCAENLDDCVGQCRNGASCIDLVNDYRCACAPGYTGRDCETDIDECANSPCRNGGECVDMVGKFNCICPLGYSGTLCEEAKDHCTPSPCLQGSCLNTPGSYYCHCPPDRAGKHCEQLRPLCSQPPCNGECEVTK